MTEYKICPDCHKAICKCGDPPPTPPPNPYRWTEPLPIPDLPDPPEDDPEDVQCWTTTGEIDPKWQQPPWPLPARAGNDEDQCLTVPSEFKIEEMPWGPVPTPTNDDAEEDGCPTCGQDWPDED